MAIAHDAPGQRGWVERFLTTDFCPGANRFVYWLKEPIGWFVLATAASVMVGMYANPVGWTIAGALFCIILAGMIWPLIAVWATACSLRPDRDAVHEETSCRMVFSVRNRLPLPLWGLAVEGYLDCEGDESLPSVALSHVPPICVADYAIEIRPELRGHYPIQKPKIACSFPFGIWTARRELMCVESLTVWPRVYEIAGSCPLTGQLNADVGDGQRGGRSGDFVGVRNFRRGDSPRHINWIQSARTESLIVTERGGPQCVELELHLDPTIAAGQSRQSLAIRIRVAASIIGNLHGSRIPTRIRVGATSVVHASGSVGWRQLLDALAEIPADGGEGSEASVASSKSLRIEISGGEPGTDGEVTVTLFDTASRASGKTRQIKINGSRELAEQLNPFWQELGYVPIAA